MGMIGTVMVVVIHTVPIQHESGQQYGRIISARTVIACRVNNAKSQISCDSFFRNLKSDCASDRLLLVVQGCKEFLSGVLYGIKSGCDILQIRISQIPGVECCCPTLSVNRRSGNIHPISDSGNSGN